MQMMGATGEMWSFRHMARATGAIMSTVATLSTKAEMNPANRDRDRTAHLTLGVLSTSTSAMSWGILDSMNRYTVPMVPTIIMITFQSISFKASMGE